MYGLIHTALRNMVLDQRGEKVWEHIVQTSGVPANSFLTMRSYDDETTLALIDSASAALGLSVEDALGAFGEYWITTFAPKEYGGLLDHTGDDPVEFLQNLDDLHDRIATAFTDFKPPSFHVVIDSQNEATVRYVSNRQGLTPFVLGILRGLGTRFSTRICIGSVTPVECEYGERSDIAISFVKADV